MHARMAGASGPGMRIGWQEVRAGEQGGVCGEVGVWAIERVWAGCVPHVETDGAKVGVE